MGTRPATTVWNLILLAFTVLFYAESYVIPYALTEDLVNVIVNGRCGRLKNKN